MEMNFITAVDICTFVILFRHVVVCSVDGLTNVTAAPNESDEMYSDQMRGRLQGSNGNYSITKETTIPTSKNSGAFPIYNNRTSKEISNGKTIFISSSSAETNRSPNKIESVTRFDRKSTTQYVDQANRNEIGSPQEPIIMRVRDSTSADIINITLNQNDSESNEEVNLAETESPLLNNTTDKINDNTLARFGASESSSSSRIIIQNDNSTADVVSFYRIHSNSTTQESWTDTKHLIHLHKYRYPKSLHRLHHLNLVPMEDGPFGTLLWKDKKYLISVLVPIGIGILGAGCIISMAYIIRFCHRNERRIHQIKENLQEGRGSNTDQVILLNDSDEEF